MTERHRSYAKKCIKGLARDTGVDEIEIEKMLSRENVTYFFVEKAQPKNKIVAAGTREEITSKYHPDGNSYYTHLPPLPL
ncbi:hypothetical protein D4Q76_00445 [archaeon]|nr:MAG: hypothetical protein D4Q76_00445 [archaeon]